MSVYTKELATDITYPHIDIYRKYRDDEHTAYEARTHEGYVMYDTTENHIDYNPDTSEYFPVTYYYTFMGMPKTYNFETNFHMVAVPRDSVDENYIFSLGDKTEVM